MSLQIEGLLRLLATVLVGLLLAGSARSQTSEEKGRTDKIDAQLVEELALFYALESYRRIKVPLVLRLLMPGDGGKKEALADLRANPPRLDDRGVAYPFGNSNPLSFVYDQEQDLLSCRWRLVRHHGGTSFFGPTALELADELNRVSTSRQRGDARFTWDEIADALSLELVFREPPARDRFYRAVDRLLRAGNRWFETRYLDEVRKISAARALPSSASARLDGFEVHLSLRHFSAGNDQIALYDRRYKHRWNRKVGRAAPHLVSDRSIRVDQTFKSYLHFAGAAKEAGQPVAVHADYRLLRADGSPVFDDVVVAIWQGGAPPPEHVVLGSNNLVITLGADEQPGEYRLEVEVCELRNARCVQLAHPFIATAGVAESADHE